MCWVLQGRCSLLTALLPRPHPRSRPTALQVSVMESGEHVLGAAGEVHLETCIKDLRERFAKIELLVRGEEGGGGSVQGACRDSRSEIRGMWQEGLSSVTSSESICCKPHCWTVSATCA